MSDFWKQYNMDKLLELKNALEIVCKFVEDVPCGCSWWEDAEGNEHTVDMGYVCAFCDQLEIYLSEKISQ